MNKFLMILSVLFFTNNFYSQELNCEVVVNADQVIGGNAQVFKTLETTINEFINQTKWTDKTYKPQEQIECSMVLTIQSQTGNNSFTGNIQVQASRPVFNSIYTTPMINYRDENLNFTYTEFEPLLFDVNTYESELVSILSYYAYLILAVDADTFATFGGDEYYKICQNITDQVENPNTKKGWKSNTNKINRYHLLNKIMASVNKQYRRSLYQYHINGLDKMSDNKSTAKENILQTIIDLKKIYNNSMSSYIYRFFMDAKSDEIVQIFSDGPKIDIRELIDVLNKIAPTNAHKWGEIKN